MKYKEKLLDPQWQKKRLCILDRDNWKCRICTNDKLTLHVHHIFYDNAYPDPWDYPDYCLITLCSSCHESEHQDYKNALVFLQHEIAKVGITSSIDIGYLQSIIRENFNEGVFRG